MTRIPGGGDYFAKFISTMTKKDNLPPIIALEGTVVLGRTYQAYKRGGLAEARERAFEEIMGSIVWLFGVKALNKVGDKILGHYLQIGDTKFDVGTDKVLRKPFDNFVKDGKCGKYTSKQVALMKGAKVVSSVLIANLIIGAVVPKINHFMTNKLRHKRAEQNNVQVAQNNNISLENDNKTQSPNFKGNGGVAALNIFTNAIENTNTGQLLSTDVGCTGGRMINARTSEERREIGIRDIGSIYFYMWAQGHIRDLLNFVETGKFYRLNPNNIKPINQHLTEFLAKNNNEMSVEEFRKQVLGKNPAEIKLPEGINFESAKLSVFDKFFNQFSKIKKEPLQVAKISDLESIFKDEKNIMNRLRDMSKLQPERLGEAVVTKQQIIDALNIAEINDPKFLSKAFNDFSGGASTDKYQYFSNKELYNYKKHMEEYVRQLCKKSKDGKITQETLKKGVRTNHIMSGINFGVGFAISAAFLSTIIPKIQYWVTRQKTGVNAFPGVYDYAHHKEFDA